MTIDENLQLRVTRLLGRVLRKAPQRPQALLASAALNRVLGEQIADGDYVMVWTAYDTDLGRDRLFMRCYDADGTPADLPLLDGDKNVIGTRIDAFPIIAVTPPSTHPALMASAQRFGSVASWQAEIT